MKKTTFLICLTTLFFMYGTLMAQNQVQLIEPIKQPTSTQTNTSVTSTEVDETITALQAQNGVNKRTKATISNFPYAESFENDFGDWVQASDDDFDWTRYSNHTPSSNTGPAGASDGTYYIYTESSSNYNQTASLEAEFDFTALANPGLFFHYHMFGVSTGSISIDAYDGTTWTNDIWKLSGQQQLTSNAPYDSTFIDLSDYGSTNGVKIRINGITGNNSSSDMAVDDIKIYNTELHQYDSALVLQEIIETYAGTNNQKIIGINIETIGIRTPLQLTQFNFSTNGTSNVADISNAKVFYNSDTLVETQQFGSTEASPNGTFSVSGSLALKPGTNYFWLVYDVSSSATATNVLDAECLSMIINSNTETPVITAPSGSRTIIDKATISLLTDTIKLASSTCNQELTDTFTITNNGLADLNYSLSELSKKNIIKVAVYGNSSNLICKVLNKQADIQATDINYYDATILKGYDVLMNLRSQDLNSDAVLEFINNGGAWIGEYGSNTHPINNWGVIEGNISNNSGSGSQSVNILDTNHYLANHIAWNDIIVGSNPCDYMYDLTGITDTTVNIIATVNHSRYPNNPLLVEKVYGAGKIILFNWDYSDDPDFDTYVENMIQEVVRYSSTSEEVSWLSTDPTSGTITPGNNLQHVVTFSTLGLKSGNYSSNIIVTSNDPMNPSDTVVCEFTVDGEPIISTSQNTVDFENVFVNGTKKQTLTVFNTGCDTLFVTSISNVESQFYTDSSALTILPFDSVLFVASFTSETIGSFTDTITLVNNDTNITIALIGTTIPAPEMLCSTDSLKTSVNECNANVQLQFTIENTGDDILEYSFKEPASGKVEVVAFTYGCELGSPAFSNTIQAINDNFTDYNLTVTNTSDSTTLDTILSGKDVLIILRQDSGSDYVFTKISGVLKSFVENGGTVIICGTWDSERISNTELFTLTYVQQNSNCNVTVLDDTHPITKGISNTFNSNRYNYFHYINNSDAISLVEYNNELSAVAYREIGQGKAIYLAFDFVEYNSYKSKILANAVKWGGGKMPGWVSPSEYAGSVAVGGSQVIDVNFDATGYVAGTYNFNMVLNSNDPVNTADTLVCEFAVSGTSEISSDVTVIDLGDLLIGDSVSRALTIYDIACDTLKVTDIISTSDDFTISQTVFNVLPTDSLVLDVKFKPTTEHYYTDTLTLKTNDKDWIIYLVGTGLYAPEMELSTDTIDISLSDCNDLGSLPLTISNMGQGSLEFVLPSSEPISLQGETTIGSSYYGLMFDISATENITLSSFDVFLSSENYDYEIEVYYYEGTYSTWPGASAWTLHGTYNVHSNSYAELDRITIDDLKLSKGDYAIYLFPKENKSICYGSNSQEFTDGTLTIKKCIGNYNFGSYVNNKSFCGSIYYKNKENWIDFSVNEGIVNPNSAQSVDVKFNAAGLYPGNYTSNVLVKSNDPQHKVDTLVCKLTVESAEPEITLESKNFDFGDELANNSSSRSIPVINTGCDTLKITNITSNLAAFTVTSASSFIVLPKDTAQVLVNFTPTTLGNYTASLTIANNDSDSVINLIGACVSAKIDSLSTNKSNGYYNAGEIISLLINYNSAVDVDTTNGKPTIKLNTDSLTYAAYKSGTGTKQLVFEYIVANEQSALLDYTSINDLELNGGTIRADGVNAGIALPVVGSFSSVYKLVIDNTNPTVTLSSESKISNQQTQKLTILFSEKVNNFSTNDLVFTNATYGSLSEIIPNQKYTINVYASYEDTISIDLKAGSCEDYAGNLNLGASQVSYVYDITKPSIACTVNGSHSVNTNSFTSIIEFSEEAAELRLSEIQVENGTATNLTELISNKKFSIDLTLKTLANAIITIDAESITDLAGNSNNTHEITIQYDTIAPVAVITTESSNPSSDSIISIYIEFEESILGFELADVILTNATADKMVPVYDTKKYQLDIKPTNCGEVFVNISADTYTDMALNNNVKSDEFKIVYDLCAPNFSNLSITNITNTTANLNATVNENGKLFYLLQLATEQAPTNEQVLNSDSIALSQNSAANASLSELVLGTAYTVYCLAQDELKNQSLMQNVNFTTTAVGINLETNTDIQIYPNPTKNVIKVNSKSLNIEQVIVTDLNGKIIRTIKNDTNKAIDLSEFETQIFLVHILTNKGITVTKIIKE